MDILPMLPADANSYRPYRISRELQTTTCAGTLVLSGISAVSITVGIHNDQLSYIIFGIFTEVVSLAVMSSLVLYSLRTQDYLTR